MGFIIKDRKEASFSFAIGYFDMLVACDCRGLEKREQVKEPLLAQQLIQVTLTPSDTIAAEIFSF
jgi:hypothetical protein